MQAGGDCREGRRGQIQRMRFARCLMKKGGRSRPPNFRAGQSSLEVHCGFSSAFRLNFVGDFLALVEPIQSGPLDCTYVDEHVFAAAVGLDEAESLCGIEPLDGACSHNLYPSELARECARTG